MKAGDLDLKRDLHFPPPPGGLVQFMGHRALIMDALAMGLLRKELIDNLGMLSARNILTRMGYAHGWATADNLDQEYPDLLKDTDCGPALHMLQGYVNVAKCEITWEPSFRMFNTWQESYEAEQHLLHMGISHEPVCWSLTGYVSGYCSRMLGREVYCIERQCLAKGDAICFNETRTREAWGDEIEPYLPFFKADTIEAVLHEVREKLLRSENTMKARLHRQAEEDSLFGATGLKSKVMRNTVDLARRIAKVESSAVITGESGVGKEHIARIIHAESARAMNPFVAINCSAITETLLESEFFGHVRGAFTGANRDRMGLIEAAKGGTLFLDEVAEISPGIQAKLLRVLQEKEIRRVGENVSRPVNVRFLAATNRNLAREVAEGRFREDLFYRLCIFELNVPPLRERTEDILPLARAFLETISRDTGKGIIGFTPEVVDALMQYEWPGNVRQLRNTIEHAAVLCEGKRIGIRDLPAGVRSRLSAKTPGDTIRSVHEVEREQILSAIRLLGGNKVEAAKRLEISLSSLYKKLKKYGVRNDGSPSS
jgi:DNA-binding NtrC family response regulator/predicted hydrocarbon binding protein